MKNNIPKHVWKQLVTMASQSNMRSQHGCVITKGKQIISSGTNNLLYHSECMAIRQCVLQQFRRK